MGTDIHLHTEIRIDGRWQPLREREPDGYRGEFEDRHYDLFAILTGVRNRNDFETKYAPRGLPDDISTEFEVAAFDDGIFGDHTFTWLTFSEVLALPFHKVATKSGWLNWTQYAVWRWKTQWRRDGTHNHGPEEWRTHIAGGSVTHVPEQLFRERYEALTMDEKRALWAATEQNAIGGEYASVNWTITYASAFTAFFTDYFLPTLAEAAERGCGPDDIRMVFGFDS